MWPGGGEILQKCKIPITGFYYGLLRFITDITEFYYGYYGTFLKDFIDSEPRPQKSPQNPHIWEKHGKIEPIYYGYYGILRNITVRNISALLGHWFQAPRGGSHPQCKTKENWLKNRGGHLFGRSFRVPPGGQLFGHGYASGHGSLVLRGSTSTISDWTQPCDDPCALYTPLGKEEDIQYCRNC